MGWHCCRRRSLLDKGAYFMFESRDGTACRERRGGRDPFSHAACSMQHPYVLLPFHVSPCLLFFPIDVRRTPAFVCANSYVYYTCHHGLVWLSLYNHAGAVWWDVVRCDAAHADAPSM